MPIKQSKFERNVNAQFRRYGDSKKVSEKYIKACVQRCEKVRKFLEKHTKSQSFSIASFHYAGSIAKNTDVVTGDRDMSDFDLIMKINEEEPPFKVVLEYFERLLKQSANRLRIIPWTIKSSEYVLHFTFINGPEVDLLPAAANLSIKQIFEKICNDRKQNNKLYSSSLVDRQVGFLKKQISLTYPVARLAKYWFKGIDFHGEYVTAGSTICELLAVAAVNKEKQYGRTGPESCVRSFIGILEYFAKLDQIGLEFSTSPGIKGNWNLREASVPQTIPYIIEPANKYNNLLEYMSPWVFSLLKKNANVLLHHMDLLLQNEKFCKVSTKRKRIVVNVDFDSLFTSV